MIITVLGTGTSTGVPIPGCRCPVCTSKNTKNRRTRCSILVQITEAEAPTKGKPEKHSRSILVDTSTDLRFQALENQIERVDAVLYTHTHADHTHGIDDLRAYNFLQNDKIPVYASNQAAKELEAKFAYCFTVDPSYQGGATANLEMNRFDDFQGLSFWGQKVLPLPLFHGTNKIHGFQFGNFAYLTDCSLIPDESLEIIKSCDYVIIDGLRHRPHATHMTVEQAVRKLESISPKKAWLTHISHELEHETCNLEIKGMTDLDIELAYDGLKFEI